MTLVEFLLARIAEDERIAMDAETNARSPWTVRNELYVEAGPAEDRFTLIYDDSGGDKINEHIALWDPARVLAECAAKRAIIQLNDYPGGLGAYDDDAYRALREMVWPLLAQPYADHPDYQREWAP